MAGEWIPIRVDLFDCPQVVRILSELCPETVLDMSERVRRTSEIVGALVRMWSLFDRYTEDGILRGYTVSVLDQIVGLPGFANAAACVGWLQINSNSLEMPEFSKYLSTTAKSRMKDAQRKKASRAASEICPQNVREKSDQNRTTKQKNTKENNTEDKKENPLKSPKGDTSGFDASAVALPEEIRNEEMQDAWVRWTRHRLEIKKPLKPTQCEAQFQQFVEWGVRRSVIAINHTIKNGWQGLREPEEARQLARIGDKQSQVETFLRTL